MQLSISIMHAYVLLYFTYFILSKQEDKKDISRNLNTEENLSVNLHKHFMNYHILCCISSVHETCFSH